MIILQLHHPPADAIQCKYLKLHIVKANTTVSTSSTESLHASGTSPQNQFYQFWMMFLESWSLLQTLKKPTTLSLHAQLWISFLRVIVFAPTTLSLHFLMFP